jgi:long-subunit fatty acid transport protein
MKPASARFAVAAFSAVLFLATSTAHAAGFEKSLLWSARSAAQAGAVTGSIEGAEALYFNPAGLEKTSGNGEISLNFSPTLSKFDGANPFQNAGTVGGKTGFSPIAALLASYRVNNDLSVGAGYYVSGGNKAKFENLDYSAGPVGPPTGGYTDTLVETDLAITELSLGAGYQIMRGLRVGAAWRAVMVDADFATITPLGAGTYGTIKVTDIGATRYNGYRLGVQYDSDDQRWGVGAAYRSSVKFTADGDGTRVTSGASPTTTQLGVVDVGNIFPQQLNVGAWFKLNSEWRISPEYSFTNYSQANSLDFSRGLTASITQNWKNQHIVRLGTEYKAVGSMPIRAGYSYTSQVTPSDFARSTFASPGAGHTIAVGTGMGISDMDFDVAAEYAMASGKGRNIQTTAGFPSVGTETDFKSHAYALHLSGKYHF